MSVVAVGITADSGDGQHTHAAPFRIVYGILPGVAYLWDVKYRQNVIYSQCRFSEHGVLFKIYTL